MSDATNLADLADFAAFRFDGPAIVFVRPKGELDPVSEENVQAGLGMLSDRFSRQFGYPVTHVLVPHDFDVMVAGEAELLKMGLARLPAPKEESANAS